MTTWKCTPLDGGHLIEASSQNITLAYMIRKSEWRDAHDREWLFASVVRTLVRNMNNVKEPK